jgi:hypothetical protein
MLENCFCDAEEPKLKPIIINKENTCTNRLLENIIQTKNKENVSAQTMFNNQVKAEMIG